MSPLADARVPVILVSGIADEPMSVLTLTLQWDLPDVVVMRHVLDPGNETLIRYVSDVTGLVDCEAIDIEDACADCALREDAVATLERLATDGRWRSIIARLPVAAEATQVCRMIEQVPEAAPGVRIAATAVALDGAAAEEDLLGDDTLLERGLPVRDDDERGVAETTAGLVEYADVVIAEGASDAAGALLTAMAPPGSAIVDSMGKVNAAELIQGVHDHERCEAWVDVVRRYPLPGTTLSEGESGPVWVLDFWSERPFHPERLQRDVEQLGGGRWRARGCFWLPSRPAQVCQWDGAGGMLSIGGHDRWADHQPLTRIVVVGTDDGREELEAALHATLLTDEELASRGPFWEVPHDGFEPWLGPVRPLTEGGF